MLVMSEKYLFIYSTAIIDGSLKVSFCRHFENLTLTQESDTLMGVPPLIWNYNFLRMGRNLRVKF